MQRKLLFLVNPISGTKNKQKAKKIIHAFAMEKGLPFEILHTNKEGQYDFLKERLEVESFTDVIIAGGDGTIRSVIAALREVKVNFGILPMGSGNGLALSSNIPRNLNKALKVIYQGKARKVEAMEVNGVFSCMLSGVGFDGKIAHDFDKSKTRGLLTYIKISLINYLKGGPYKFRLHIGNLNFDLQAWFICIAVGNQFGNSVTIAPKASLSDGLIDLIAVRKMNKFMLPFRVVNQLFGFNPMIKLGPDLKSIPKVIYYQSTEFYIENPTLAPMHVDGDPIEASEKIKISIIPDCYSLIMPD